MNKPGTRATRATRISVVALGRGALFAVLAGSCGGEGVVRSPPSNSAVVHTAPATREATGKELAPDVPTLRAVLEDAQFSSVKERLRAKDAAGAAKAFDDARAATVEAPGGRTCALDYESGRLHRDAGEDAAALAAFDRVPEACALSAHAALYAAQACSRLGRTDDAIARARRVPDDTAIASEARLTLAEALAAKGDRGAALPIWRAHLAANPHGTRWVDTAVKVATALLDGVDGERAGHAREAFDLATRVVVEAPKLAEASGGQAARDRAVALLRQSDPKLDDSLAVSDRVRRAQAWLDANEPAHAVAEVTPLLALGAPSVPVGADVCHAAIVRAQATAKLRGATADAYGDAIARCAGDDALPSALFAGAKASLSAKHLDEGLARLARVEQEFPRHRLADDARLRRAIVLQQNGDDAKGEALLASFAEDYPEGDMRGEALFRLALARMVRADWIGAIEPLDRAASLEEGDHRSPSSGRAAYFRARVSAMTGDLPDAETRYEALIGHAPLAFYMTQAYGRLATVDPVRARRALDGAVENEAQALPASLLTRDHPELHAPEFVRGCALLEVGEIDDGRRELGRLLGDAVDAEVLWTTALLYERAAAPDVAQMVIGSRLGELLSHYPAGGWKARWEIAFPRPYGDLVERASAESNIPSALTWAIMRQESAFVADAKSPSDAYGLMQLIVGTARGVARGTGFGSDPDSLKRPDVSITLGAKLLGGLRASYPSNRALAIAAYNGGGGSVARWLAARPNEDFDLWVEQIPFDETRNYLKRVLGNEAAYAFLYAPSALDEVLALPTRIAR
ncbi:MAG: transglycosylase SLT domain-containing protein [Polyangiaceae bacterium]